MWSMSEKGGDEDTLRSRHIDNNHVEDEEEALLPKERGVSIQTDDDDDSIENLLKPDTEMSASDKVKEEMERIKKLEELNTPRR